MQKNDKHDHLERSLELLMKRHSANKNEVDNFQHNVEPSILNSSLMDEETRCKYIFIFLSIILIGILIGVKLAF